MSSPQLLRSHAIKKRTNHSIIDKIWTL